ncbi:hypothetical protein SEVIR_9G071000v4 [Setaria viridis]|uniref:DUF3741 domain-containing protein n=2 Tax=Setaria TaxID=4554 RepID=K4A5E3_SETIT|nr:uncharacterized protein LOC101756602 [Setaria italica]XP_034573708.1 uncharacterized protein LOC117837978 [Setaria viridis]RCV40645.1 hypothetical protein SETIT_9G071900v2 [Setaria italica]
MAKVPDLGSDFAQKLLKDLRRRRERLGFESAPPPAQRGTANTAAPRDAYSNSRKPIQFQKPQQAAPAPRVGRSEAATNRLYRQGNSSIAGGSKPRRHDAPPVAHSHAIVPFQGGGGSKRTTPAANTGVDMQMALALALSNSGKLHNVQLVARQGTGASMFFGEPDRTTTQARHLLTPGAHVGKVAIGVQKLNDILMAYSSGGVRRGSVEIGKQLLRGAMDLEESLSMLMMLQDASDYMETSGEGKVLLLEGGKENWKSSTPHSTSSASARLVEIVDDDSETEQADNARSPSDAFMQIVPHSLSQNYRSNQSSPLQFTAVTNNSKSNATSGEKDDSKVRMPSLIAKLMGLENLPSAKAVAERKGTERFVKPEAVPRRATAKNAMVGTLPIRIIASERVPSKGQSKNFQTREWNISLTKSEEPVLSNRFSHLMSDKQTRQTMRQVLSKQEGTDRRASLSQVVDDKIVHQDMKLTEDSNQQKTAISAGKKMNFLQRFRKNAKNKPVTEEKDIVQENKQNLGKKQTISIKQRDSEVKPRRTREKFNKENLATPESKAQGKNGKTAKTDKMRRQPQSKLTDKHIMDIMEKKVQSYSRTTQSETASQNYRRTKSETASQNLEHKRPLRSEPKRTKEKFEYIAMTELKNAEETKVDDTGAPKPLDNTPSDDGVFKQSTVEMKDSNSTSGISADQSEKQFTEEINDPITTVEQTTADSIAEENDARVDHTSSETTQILETISEGELQEQQLQQMTEVHDQSRNGLDHIMKPDNLTDSKNHKMIVVSCDSFTENQLLLTEMLLKDPYLLETAKAITGFHAPVSAIHVNTGKWLDKGNEVLSDVGREVIRRKGKRTEAMVDVSTTRTANLKLQTLSDLIRELDGDIQSLNIPRKLHQQSDNSTAENLKMVLLSDIEHTHSDANSVWDFGWNRLRDLPIEKNEVVKDLEKNILGGIITDVARELIDVSLRHGCCACEA